MLSDSEESVIKSSENAHNKDYEITIASSFLLNFYFQLKLVGNPLVLDRIKRFRPLVDFMKQMAPQ